MSKLGIRSAARTVRLCAMIALAATTSRRALAQAPTIPFGGHDPGSVSSRLGPTPGAGANPFRMSPGTDPQFLGGRVGTSAPRVPSSITTPGDPNATPTRGITAPARLKITDVPLYGPLEVPAAREEEGPPNGLTLDAAIDRLLRENLFLSSQRWQIPAARADVLTASLRANPILYADGQLVPYGRYTRDRPGGPTQYDLNVTHPVDYSGKRVARTRSAEVVVSIQEAQYQDAVRLAIDNLYTAFVDALAARETVRYAEASEIGLKRLLDINEVLYKRSNVTRADVNRVRGLFEAAGLARLDADETYKRTRRTLGVLLNLPAGTADTLSLRGTIADNAPPPPGPDELAAMALASRPDLAAMRLGVGRAQADNRVALANRFGDAYVLYQPYTFQDNSPSGLKSPTSWALGVTVPIPIYNRNQGGVLRSRLNIQQSEVEVVGLERRIVAEVLDAHRNYQVTRELVHSLETDLIPAARQYREDTIRLFVAGNHKITAIEVNNAQKDYNQAVRQYRDALIRHRRGMLTLNTTVGRRVLP